MTISELNSVLAIIEPQIKAKCGNESIRLSATEKSENSGLFTVNRYIAIEETEFNQPMRVTCNITQNTLTRILTDYFKREMRRRKNDTKRISNSRI